jgi:hypothetical protein
MKPLLAYSFSYTAPWPRALIDQPPTALQGVPHRRTGQSLQAGPVPLPTGGKDRSVAVANAVADRVAATLPLTVVVRHLCAHRPCGTDQRDSE